jgi:hypothetical protein
LWHWGLNSWLCVCKAGIGKACILPLESYLQSSSLWLFWRWGLVNYLSGLASNLNPPNLSLLVAGITGVSHWYPALHHFYCSNSSYYHLPPGQLY